MVKELNCRESGHEDCAFLIRDENEDELVSLVQQQSEQTHGSNLSQDDVRGMMKEV